jgi:hypothetical protein
MRVNPNWAPLAANRYTFAFFVKRYAVVFFELRGFSA